MSRLSATSPARRRGGRAIVVLRSAAVLTFLAASLTAVIVGRGERSGFISMGQPGAWDFSESMLGYCYLHGPTPFMKENIPHVTQVGLFNGVSEAQRLCEFPQEFRYLRGWYSFLGSLLAPPLDVISALLVVNWLCWAACAWSAWRLTRDAFHSEHAAALAAMLTAGGIGMTAHIHDYSPHLLAFATYFFGVWLLYRSRVWRRRRPWRTHLRLGMYLFAASLAYNTGIMLTAAYVMTSLRRNRPLPIFAAALMGLAARPLWRQVLNMPVDDQEARFLGFALKHWQALLHTDLDAMIRAPLRWLAECILFFDSPLVVLLGLVAILAAPMSLPKRWFGLAVVGMPILAAWMIVPATSARGYIVWSGAVWIFACLAWQAARGLTSPRPLVRGATLAATVIVLATHFVWSETHLIRYWGPIKSYFVGVDEGRMYFLPPEVMSLTGEEPAPVLFGGTASLVDAGVYVAPQEHRLKAGDISFLTALRYGGFYFVCLALLLCAAGRTRRQRATWLAVWAGVYLTSCVWTLLVFRSLPAFFPVSRAIVLEPGDGLRLAVELSPTFTQKLRDMTQEGDQVVFYTLHRRQEGLEIVFVAGETTLPVTPRGLFDEYLLEEKGSIVQRALGEALPFSMEVTNRSNQSRELGGWQRARLPRRTMTLSLAQGEAAQPPVLPICEIRLYSASGRLKLAGF